MSNAAQAIWDRASSDADRVALRGASEPWTYGRLCERAGFRLASAAAECRFGKDLTIERWELEL